MDKQEKHDFMRSCYNIYFGMERVLLHVRSSREKYPGATWKCTNCSEVAKFAPADKVANYNRQFGFWAFVGSADEEVNPEYILCYECYSTLKTAAMDYYASYKLDSYVKSI